VSNIKRDLVGSSHKTYKVDCVGNMYGVLVLVLVSERGTVLVTHEVAHRIRYGIRWRKGVPCSVFSRVKLPVSKWA
jgi:hypothetical protein